MTRLVFGDNVYDWINLRREDELEQAIRNNVEYIFGKDRYYIDCKRVIGKKGEKQNIPDAYLIDLRRDNPQLFVVENELASHDPYKHLGPQLLGFFRSYHQAKRRIKKILFDEISNNKDILSKFEKYAKENKFRNTDNLLDHLVNETEFKVLVIIDNESEEYLQVIKQFKFPIETIQFVTYINKGGEKAFRFNPFLQDIEVQIEKEGEKKVDISDLDTIIVPAREDGFQETFIGEDRWYAIRIHASMIEQIKYVAAYRVYPISAITHVARVKNIVPWKETGKYCIEFDEPAKEISEIKLGKPGRVFAPYSPRYANLEKLLKAKTIAEYFS